ncbi:MAG: hypothetical protein ACI89X_001397 [Planctomycetota bacterium]
MNHAIRVGPFGGGAIRFITSAMAIGNGAFGLGAMLYNEGFAFCEAAPTGFVLSSFQSLTIGSL